VGGGGGVCVGGADRDRQSETVRDRQTGKQTRGRQRETKDSPA
jgi:hypothetical protein